MIRRLTGLAAALGMAAIIVGLPILLLATHHMAVPRLGWTWDGLWHALLSPDDGTLLITLFKAAGWLSWLLLTTAIVMDIASRARRVPVPQVRGFALPQALARALVTAVLAGFIATNVATAPGPSFGAPVTPSAPAHTAGAPASPRYPSPSAPTTDHKAAPRTQTYTVRKGDTLSEIALRTLGDARAYPKIVNASKDTVQPDGRKLTDPDLIIPGWKLTIPTGKAKETDKRHTTKPAEQPTVTVPEEAPTPSTSGPSATPTPTTATSAPAATPSAATPVATTAPVTEDDEPNAAPGDIDVGDVAEDHSPVWQLAGLAGAGGLLAGGLLLALRRRRRAQFRARRPGRSIAVPDPELAPVEKTFRHDGGPTADLVTQIDEGLRRLAAALIDNGQPVPRLLGVDATHEILSVRMLEPVELPAPWRSREDGHQWQIVTSDIASIGAFDEDSSPPWPQLVTIGTDDAGAWRLLNLETLGVVSLTGDPVFAADLARYLATELTIAPWARDVQVECLGVCNELAGLNPARLRHHDGDGTVCDLVASAKGTVDRLDAAGLNQVETARVEQAADELWESRILIAENGQTSPDRDELTQLLTQQPGRTATTILLIGADQTVEGIEIHLTNNGRAIIPALGMDVVVNGLTRAEALGCVAVLTASESLDDTQMPVEDQPTETWEGMCNTAGQLLDTLTVPRGSDTAELVTTLLPADDDRYLQTTANTAEDLAALAPLVPTNVREMAEAADPTLDDDLATWRADSCDRPRLSVLGPPRVRVGRHGDATKVARRVPYYTELVAFLASRKGATTQEVADALGIADLRVRKDISVARAWLGVDPRTGQPFLPEATRSAEAIRRGVGLYLVEEILVDANLFRRLRVRAEARGVDGLPDLLAALQLVTGTPYDGLLSRGRPWLTETRPDQTLLCAIVDIAHLVTTITLETGNTKQARAAAELAMLVAPDETTPALDVAAVAAHEGRNDEAVALARAIVDWRDGSGDAPLEIPSRAERILQTHRWLEPEMQAR